MKTEAEIQANRQKRAKPIEYQGREYLAHGSAYANYRRVVDRLEARIARLEAEIAELKGGE